MGREALAPPSLSTRCRIAGGTAMRGAHELRCSDGARWVAGGSTAPVLHVAEPFDAFAFWVTEGHEDCRRRRKEQRLWPAGPKARLPPPREAVAGPNSNPQRTTRH